MRTSLIAPIAALFVLLIGGRGLSQPAAPRLELETPRLRVALTEAARGGVVSLTDKSTGRELIAPQARPRLFELEFSDPRSPGSPPVTLNNWDAATLSLERGDPRRGTPGRIVFSGLGGRPVRVQCTFSASPDDPMLRCRIEVACDGPLVLESVRFPILKLRAVPTEGAGDAFVLGATKGGIHLRPSAAKVGASISARQPGDLAAQFGCWYDDRVGLFTAAFDPQGCRKSLSLVRTADGLTLSWFQSLFVKGRFAQDYDLALATFHGAEPGAAPDWRDGADLYKAWAIRQPWCARTYAQRDDLPAWLRQGPAMVRFSRDWLRRPATIEAWLRDYWKGGFPEGTPLLIAYWGWEKVDTWITPDYFPVYPSDKEFRMLAELGRSLGGHTFAWPSGYHYTLTYQKRPDGSFAWDDRRRFDETARPHAVVNRDGQLYLRTPSWLDGGQTACMCPGDPWTIDWFNAIATGLAQRGAELIQVDQVVGGAFPPCYRDDHGHPPGPGLWATAAFRRQLQTMLAECRKIQPGAVVCFEEPNEHFMQLAGIQDYRDWEVLKQPGIQPASVFNYLYHEYLPTFQSNPRRGDRLQAAWCLVNGQIPHLVPDKATGPGPLLQGGDFELPGARVPEGWEKVDGYQGRAYTGETVRDEAEQHGGRASLRLANRGADEIAQAAQNIAAGKTFVPGRTYQLSAWIKTRGLQKGNAVALGAFTGAMKSLASWRIDMPGPSSDWTRGQVCFTLPTGAALLRIMLQIRGAGTAWIDGVRLEEVRPDGALAEVQRPARPEDHEFMADWVRLFHGPGRPYLLLGRMLRPPRLECAAQEAAGCRFPTILHNAFEAPDGSRAVILINATGVPQRGRLSWQGQAREIQLAPWQTRLVR